MLFHKTASFSGNDTCSLRKEAGWGILNGIIIT